MGDDKEASAAVAFSPDNYQYGTLFYSSFKMLLDSPKVSPLVAKLLETDQPLYILGSNMGNEAMYAAVGWGLKVVGVELQCHLVDKANKLLQEHASAKVAAQIEFKCADAMSVDLSAATLVYMDNEIWDRWAVIKVYEHLATTLPDGATVIGWKDWTNQIPPVAGTWWQSMGSVGVTASWTATLQKVYLDQLMRLPEGQVQCHEESNVKWYQEAQVIAARVAPASLPAQYTFLPEQTDLCEADSDVEDCHEMQSEYQHVVVLDTGRAFGKSLYIDCLTQSAEADEIVYHEALVHAAMLAHPTGPKKVFMAGGGEGGTAREVLKYSTVEQLLEVDLDDAVMNLTRHALPYWDQSGAFDDPRFELRVADALVELEASKPGSWDVIIWDLPDAHAGTVFLYLQPVMQLIKSRLAPDGVFVSHAGGEACCNLNHPTCKHAPSFLKTLKLTFGHADPLFAPMPVWGILHMFVVASADSNAIPSKVTAAELELRIANRIKPGQQLNFYNSQIHQLLLHADPGYRQFMDDPSHEVLTKEHTERTYKPELLGDYMTKWKKCSCDISKCVEHKGGFA